MRSCNIDKYSILVNGDDSVVVIEKSQLAVTRNLNIFRYYGFNMKYEVTDDFSRLDFCQARPVETDYGWTMARRPDRLLGRTSWSVKMFGKTKMRSFVHTLGVCERAASWGVPVASALATKMIESTVGARMMKLSPWLTEHYALMQRWWKNGKPSVSNIARVSFYEAWDISPEEQMKIEASILVRLVARPTELQLQYYHDLVNH